MINQALLALVTEIEVKEAAFQLGRIKAPGPDGFSGVFFQDNWSVVRKDVVDLVNNFYSTGNLNPKINQTLLVLVLKK